MLFILIKTIKHLIERLNYISDFGVGFNFFVLLKTSLKVPKIGVCGGRGEIRTLGTVASTSP
jgi:hypothetical protein